MPGTHLIGARIRELREARSLTQGQLAYKADTTVSQISRLENDERPNAQAATLARISAALNTTVDYLMGMTDNPYRADPPPPDPISPEARELVDKILPKWLELRRLDPKAAAAVVNLFAMQAESHLVLARALQNYIEESERNRETQ